jgi:hypothetical protein
MTAGGFAPSAIIRDAWIVDDTARMVVPRRTHRHRGIQVGFVTKTLYFYCVDLPSARQVRPGIRDG